MVSECDRIPDWWLHVFIEIFEIIPLPCGRKSWRFGGKWRVYEIVIGWDGEEHAFEAFIKFHDMKMNQESQLALKHL